MKTKKKKPLWKQLDEAKFFQGIDFAKEEDEE